MNEKYTHAHTPLLVVTPPLYTSVLIGSVREIIPCVIPKGIIMRIIKYEKALFLSFGGVFFFSSVRQNKNMVNWRPNVTGVDIYTQVFSVTKLLYENELRWQTNKQLNYKWKKIKLKKYIYTTTDLKILLRIEKKVGVKTKMASLTPGSPTSPTKSGSISKKDKGGWMNTLTRRREKSKKEGNYLSVGELAPLIFLLSKSQHVFLSENEFHKREIDVQYFNILVYFVTDKKT